MKFILSLLGLLLSFQLVQAQQTINSVASGNWSAATTWDLGRAPEDGDIIVVQPAHTVRFDHSARLANIVMRVSGKLTMAAGTGLELSASSIINVLTGAHIDAETHSGDAWITLGGQTKYRSSKTYEPSWGTGDLLGLAYATSTSGSVDLGGQGFIFGTLPAVWQDLQLFTTPESFVQMIWVTSHENTARVFSIQRSTDSRSWKTIGTIMSEGVNLGQVIYSFIDNSPGTGLIYYRVGQENGDGSITMTPIRSVRLEVVTSTVLRAYPNPTTNTVRLVLPTAATKDLSYTWMDMSGKLLGRGIAPAGKSTIDADLTNYPAGVYMIRIQTADRPMLMKVVKY